MPARRPLDPHLTAVPIRTREHADWGVPLSRLRSPDVAHPFVGVNVVGEPIGVHARADAFAPLLRPGDAFSHTTAAALFGAELPRHIQHERRIHVTSVGGGDRFRRRGVQGHRAAHVPLVIHDGLPVVEPASAWMQCAALLSFRDLVAVGDRWVTPQGHGTARRPPLTSLDELRRTVMECGGARGAARARQALAAVRVGPESRMETLLRLVLIGSGLPEPLVAPPIEIEGRTLHPDLAYPQWGVVLEYEGDGHRTDPRQWRRDIWRREAFESAGYRVIRVHSDDVLAEPEAFLARVCRILAQRQAGATTGQLLQSGDR